ncbi:DnaJ-domain-containing protein, partial [Ramicandelaber brevisporus]
SPFPNYYADLGVPPTATPEEIRAAYMRLALETHPDRHPNEPASRYVPQFQRLADAYFTLSDPRRRREYDTARRLHQASSATASSSSSSSPSAGTDAGVGARRTNAGSVFIDVFGPLLEPQIENPSHFYRTVGYVSGGALGFIVANLPGAIGGAYLGGKLGAVRDNQGVSVMDAFARLPAARRYSILQALLVQII